MPQNTVNYGFRIPLADGSDNIVPDDLRLPITAIDTAIKARADAIAAANVTIAAHTASINALGPAGVWADYVATIRTDVGAAAAAGTAVTISRWTKIGKTVFVYGEGSAAALVANASFMLPAAAGVPLNRNLLAGSMFIFNAAGSPAQVGVARMTTAKDRVLCVTGTNAFVDAAAGSTIQINVCYEVA